jgi:photosystem II stability/assembly factor-like uncharacterized protein
MYKPKLAKIIFAFILIFISSNSINSQSGWTLIGVNSSQLRCLYFFSDQTGWVVGFEGSILMTTNAGLNWTNQPTGCSDCVFYSVFFPSALRGYAVGGYNGTSTQMTPIVSTTNGGLNWVFQTSGTYAYLTSVCFTSDNEGWAVGDSAVILHTSNGGSSWLKISSGGNLTYNGVTFITPSTGWVIGSGGVILKTTNTGQNWSTQHLDSTYLLLEARFPSANTGYVVGGIPITSTPGIILKTTNSGDNWNLLNIPQVGYQDYLSFVNENTGWVCGLNNSVLYTSDGGSNWTIQQIPNVGWVTSIQFVNASTGYASAVAEYILKTTTGGFEGINPISGEVPEKFSLSQNYPNPFNPSTTIKFEIPKSTFVKIIVYDVLGKEVKTLVNQYVVTGAYTVDIDVSDLSSGTYFYRMNAGEFIMTKKMVLIK